MTVLSQREVEEIASRAARQAVEETFIRLGIDPTDPIEAQRDMQHLREWRLAVAAIKSKGMLALLGILVSGLAAAVWLGFRELLSR